MQRISFANVLLWTAATISAAVCLFHEEVVFILTVTPKYYEKFRCSASSCSDSCCQNWEIDIDEKAFAHYRAVPGILGQKLAQTITVENNCASFRLTEDRRCPFLNKQNLCELILELGEDSLCQICTDHPRFYNCLPVLEEVGIGLCCEEAASLILDSSIDNTLVFSFDSNSAEESHGLPDSFLIQLQLLDTIESFQAVWEPKLEGTASPIAEKWADLFYKEKTIQRVCQFLLKQEIIKEEWRDALTDLLHRLSSVLPSRHPFYSDYPEAKQDYARLLHYFFYRYLLHPEVADEQSLIFEETLSEELKFCFLCVGMIHLLDVRLWLQKGSFCLTDQIAVCKLFSQEVEYDDEITSALHSFRLY